MNIMLWGILALTVLTANAVAGTRSHLDQAMQYSEAALYARDGKTLIEKAEEAKQQASLASAEKVDGKHREQGLQCLDNAIKEAKAGNVEAARTASKDALDHFTRAAQ
ncbi:MAG: hypothetical protein IT524_02800 [Nitrosomonas sp.]|uniref:small metal-binding protein SmbP n=1 Tax=Nitrosomonas sp. JL21 TaxID=153949 RepID=UPI00136D003F|nr:small metal-binding protein SmbP [Nitrosomonas sp. JL21]MBL8497445.1 hypothetical protein [Nitrosomonas sp.]MCC7090880.1 hypothetical protein [Nitrosomonas sp.]